MAAIEQPISGSGPLSDLDIQVRRIVSPHLGIGEPALDTSFATGDRPAPVLELLEREGRYRRALAIADGIAALMGMLFTLAAFGTRPTWFVLLVPVIAVTVAKIQGLYDRDDQVIVKRNLAEWRTILQSNLLAGIAVYLAWTVLTDATAARGMRMFLLLVLASFVCSVNGRMLARRIARSRSPLEHCILLGEASRLEHVVRRLLGLPGVHFVGTVSEASLSGSIGELRAVVEAFGVHRIIVAHAHEPDNRTLRLIEAARFLGVRVSLVPSVMSAVGGFAMIEELDGLTLLGVPRFGLSRSSTLLKRCFDLVVGTVALVLLAPLMAAIAVAIKLDSPGPVLFCQTRIGRGGRPFRIFKFRSMVDGADLMKAALLAQNEAEDGLFKMVGDPRITRVGRTIRATHLDELPQLLNVFRGEMSLVGPRPLVLEEDERVTGRDRHRSALVPGITGPWQLKGPLTTPLSEMAKLDYRYASAWSIWQDLDILIRTVLRVLDRGGH